MGSLPFHITFIQLLHPNSLEAAWLDHHRHHQQRRISLRTPAPPLCHNASEFTVNTCSQGSTQLAAIQREEETGEGTRLVNGNTAVLSSSAERSSNTSAPEAETSNSVDDGCLQITEETTESLSGRPNESSRLEQQNVEIGAGEEGLWSIVIPTYNRLPILTKCLHALEEQVDYELAGVARYQIILVDDGSTDGTVDFLLDRRAGGYHFHDTDAGSPAGDRDPKPRRGENALAIEQSTRFPHVKLIRQKHAGATKARNLGLKHANGAVIVFIDSDLVVTRSFLRAHGEALREAFREDGDDRAFTYGRVINTSNFSNPQSEKFKVTDYSAAFFATGNVAISRQRLMEAGKLLGPDVDGPFDDVFSEYGWEDLELGVRLKQLGSRIKHAPDAIGYHWHPAFSVDQLPKLIEQEKQRGRNGFRFYQKHPTLYVRLMIQMTPFHELLWFVLTLGGLLNERTLEPLLRQLEMKDMNQIAAALVSPVLNWHTVQAVKEESKKLKVN
ncbi:hypothetical protein R1sor_022536 [Riccia sorocarpa]|uniref:Glycosyltransferase 2-like domain-containing protein n=1 Tax=Riccia sorocarpa TaxID=122646 RepID=A0ABD3GNB1_9MARC